MELRMQHVVTLFMQSEGATEVFSKILPDFFRDNTKQPIDAWGTPIGIVFPGRYFADVYPNGDMFAEDESGDQTVRDQAEDGLGSCMNRMPYFVSAGPDRTWGYRFQANGGPVDGDDLSRAIWEASHDNIYSYDPFIVENAQ
jgi:hypothetical protein